jgi:hypothetical protein
LVRSSGLNVTNNGLAARLDVDVLDNHFLVISATVLVERRDLFDELSLQLRGAF